MKKFLLSILTILYMTMSSGIAMEVHYCMGKKAGVDFYKTADHKCARCGMKNKAGCCHDEYKFYKLSPEHKSVHNVVPALNPVICLVNHSYFIKDDRVNASGTIIHDFLPPVDYGLPLFLQYRVFRI